MVEPLSSAMLTVAGKFLVKQVDAERTPRVTINSDARVARCCRSAQTLLMKIFVCSAARGGGRRLKVGSLDSVQARSASLPVFEVMDFLPRIGGEPRR